MAGLILAPEALADLAAAVAYTQEFSPLAAQRLAIRLRAAGESLSRFPERERSNRHGRRELAIVRPYLILYRLNDGKPEIPQIRHGARRRAP